MSWGRHGDRLASYAYGPKPAYTRHQRVLPCQNGDSCQHTEVANLQVRRHSPTCTKSCAVITASSA
jgi:hypothetical protein